MGAQGPEIDVQFPPGTLPRRVVNLCANNYLGLSSHPRVLAAAHAGLDSRGYGMSSVRFICGTQDIHRELEDRLTAFLGTEDTLLFPSCMDANAGVFEALLGEQDVMIADRLVHASVVDGMRLAKAQQDTFKHSDKWGDSLATIEPSGPKAVNMWCHTCHRGRPRPTTLEEELAEIHETEGIEATVAAYRELRERFYGRGAFDFGENVLNMIGYALLQEGNPPDAVAIFQLNAEQYPQSANVWDSLGEGYMAAGDTARAIEAYRKSLELDPENENAREKLTEMGAG